MPTVSIILPTFNRAKFLPEAFAAIASQKSTDWELVIVDDGSTDGTRDLVPQLAADFGQPVRYVFQKNQGAYGARNTGLDLATGKYIAFYDSDDRWLPHHLKDCVDALEGNPDVDWVYGACQIVDYATGEEITPSTFFMDGKPRKFLKSPGCRRGPLHVLAKRSSLQFALSEGLYAGLQNSVIRRSIFTNRRFCVAHSNESEDAMFVARLALQGAQFGYFDNVHVIYHRHDSHSSAAGQVDAMKQERLLLAMLQGCSDLLSEMGEHRHAQRIFRKTMAKIQFWRLGYATYWANGERRKALRTFRDGLALDPFNIRFWKTYVLAQLRTYFSSMRVR